MKKFALIIAGVMVAGMAQAASQALTTSDDILAQNVTLLNEDVRINLSTNVMAAVAYDDTQVVIATCHTAGRTVARNVSVTDDTTTPATVTITEKSGAEMPTATTLKGTVIKEYPESTCDTAAANVASHAAAVLAR